MAKTVENNATINTITAKQSHTDEMNFCKTWLEAVTNRAFVQTPDKDSDVANEAGGTYAYMMKIGGDSHEVRFETWLTSRSKKGVFIDLYLGDVYVATDTIDATLLQSYRAYHKNNETKYASVPMYVLKDFYEANDLILRDTKAKKNAKAV
jgi:hypothetical protein